MSRVTGLAGVACLEILKVVIDLVFATTWHPVSASHVGESAGLVCVSRKGPVAMLISSARHVM